jgi:hypothetical protein
MINDAKKALAGLELMMAIVEEINARRPDLVQQAAAKVLGVNANVGDDVFNAILDKRAAAVTHFDKYADRVAELEHALTQVRDLARRPSHYASGVRPDIQVRCNEVLTPGTPNRVAGLEEAIKGLVAMLPEEKKQAATGIVYRALNK